MHYELLIIHRPVNRVQQQIPRNKHPRVGSAVDDAFVNKGAVSVMRAFEKRIKSAAFDIKGPHYDKRKPAKPRRAVRSRALWQPAALLRVIKSLFRACGVRVHTPRRLQHKQGGVFETDALLPKEPFNPVRRLRVKKSPVKRKTQGN
jgi:hypothetical protein